jgi:hypothetical protein
MDRLRNALNNLRAIANRLPYDRHRNLVHRYGETVWLPSNVELVFRSPQPRAAERQKSSSEASAPAKSPEPSASQAQELGPTEAAIPAPAGRPGTIENFSPRVASGRTSGTLQSRLDAANHQRAPAGHEPDREKMLIMIHEGAKAEYDEKARQRIGAAYVAGLFYLVAGVLILWILVIQSAQIIEHTNWHWSPIPSAAAKFAASGHQTDASATAMR